MIISLSISSDEKNYSPGALLMFTCQTDWDTLQCHKSPIIVKLADSHFLPLFYLTPFYRKSVCRPLPWTIGWPSPLDLHIS